MADNLVEKILKDHVESGTYEQGEEVGLRIDQCLLQDATGTMACLQLEQMGVDRVQVPLAVQYVDHNIIQLDHKNPDDHIFLQAFAAKYGLYFSRPGNGICHYIHVERFAKPGTTLIGADSHTTTSGAVGQIAIGVGGLDVSLVMAGNPLNNAVPPVVGVGLTGGLQDWVTPKDVILELLRRRDVDGGAGRIFEFYGPGVATIPVEGRMTICNMMIETGATTGIFPSDERTREWMEAQQRPDDFIELKADEGAEYDEHEHIDLSELEPLIAQPSDSVSVRTFNRNFPGRSGTQDDHVYLCSPPTAAATALYGVITDPRELGDYPDLDEAPRYPAVDDSQILEPAPEDEAGGIEIPRGPNIHEPPEPPELPDELTGRVTIVLPDNISTGDLSPDGVEVMAFRSNIPELAKYTLRRFDPEFPEKAQEMAPGFIVAGKNYGQGSSREHAALSPLHLGIRAVIAKSFPRIHGRNLISQGIVPLLFENEEAYEKFEQGQERTLGDTRQP